jgi:transcriptional regulator with XRE-family HTH domain
MKFSEAFNQTVDEFNLSAKQLALSAGVREATVSEFRRGIREIHTSNLEKLISVLPSDAKQFLFLKVLIGQMDSKGIATLLNAIAYELRNEDKIPEKPTRIHEAVVKPETALPFEPALSLR